MIKSFLLLIACATVAVAVDYTLPAANQGQWTVGTHTGVTGGLDQYRAGGAEARGAEGGGTTITVTASPYNADNTGATDASVAINAAIDAAVPGDLVYLPAGTYRLDSGLAVEHDQDGITIRGAGVGVTIIDLRANTGIGLGTGGYFTDNSQVVTGTGGSAGSWPKGATVLNVASSAAYVTGYLARIYIENEADNTRMTAGVNPAFSLDGEPESRRHIVKITGVAAGAITIDPPLPINCANYDLRICTSLLPHWRLEHVGVEDLTITGANASPFAGVDMQYVDECWVYNCEIIVVGNYPIKGENAYRCEVRHCKLGERPTPGSNGAAVLWNTCTSGVIADNIFYDTSPLMEENFGSMNNVWAYNLGAEITGTPFDVNHGAHNCLNLYEGNVARGYQADGYFGTVSHVTMYRNWWHASDDTGSVQANAAVQNRFTRNFLHVGNVFGWDTKAIPNNSYGNPNMGNGSTTGTAQPTLGDFWIDWAMTGTVLTKTSDTEAVITVSSVGGMTVGLGSGNNGPCVYWNSRANRRMKMQVLAISGLNVTFGVSGYDGGDAFPTAGTAVVIYPNVNVYQEADLDCFASTIEVENYTGSLTAGAVTNGTSDTLLASLAYTARPAWFTPGLTWPPINPDAPNFTIASTIPAAARYYEVVPEVTGPVFNVTGNVTIGGTLSLGN